MAEPGFPQSARVAGAGGGAYLPGIVSTIGRTAMSSRVVVVGIKVITVIPPLV